MQIDPCDPNPTRYASSPCDCSGFDLWAALAEAGLAVKLSMDPFLDHIELRARITR